jgi:hypothetical protein
MGVPGINGVVASGLSPYGKPDKANGVLQGTMAAIGPTPAFPFLGPMNLWIWCEYNPATFTTTQGSLNFSVSAPGDIAIGQSIKGANIPYGTVVGTFATPNGTLLLPTYTYFGSIINGVAQITGLDDTSKLLGATVSGYGIPAGTTVSAILVASIAPTLEDPGRKGTVSLNNAVNLAPPDNSRLPFTFALAAAGAVVSGADATAVFTGAAVGITGTVQLERSFDGGQTWIPCNIGNTGTLAVWNTTAPVSISFGEPEQNVIYRLNNLTQTPETNTALKYRVSETGQAARSLALPLIA